MKRAKRSWGKKSKCKYIIILQTNEEKCYQPIQLGTEAQACKHSKDKELQVKLSYTVSSRSAGGGGGGREEKEREDFINNGRDSEIHSVNLTQLRISWEESTIQGLLRAGWHAEGIHTIRNFFKFFPFFFNHLFFMFMCVYRCPSN